MNNTVKTEVPLSIAKEMYLSCNETLCKFALSIYNHDQLTKPYYAQFKTVQDVFGHNSKLDRDNCSEFFDKLRDKMNYEHCVDYFSDKLYSPIIKVVEEKYIKNYLVSQLCGKFEIMDLDFVHKKYYLVVVTKNEYLPIRGIFNFSNEGTPDIKSGNVAINSNLLFATPEIAMHVAQHFAKEIFEMYVKQLVMSSVSLFKWLSL